jgi:hypothetical protein
MAEEVQDLEKSELRRLSPGRRIRHGFADTKRGLKDMYAGTTEGVVDICNTGKNAVYLLEPAILPAMASGFVYSQAANIAPIIAQGFVENYPTVAQNMAGLPFGPYELIYSSTVAIPMGLVFLYGSHKTGFLKNAVEKLSSSRHKKQPGIR